MRNNIQLKEAVFNHVVLEGTSYGVGRIQGEIFRRGQERYKFLTSLPPGMAKLSKRRTEEAMEVFDKYCPGINDEMKGAASVLGVPLDRLSYYSFAYSMHAVKHSNAGNCSQFAILPSASDDNHTHVGYNYDLHPDYSDLRLCTTRVKGKASHIGFSEDIFGRADGINEHGLCVTTTNVQGSQPKHEKGFEYHAVVRTILDRCKTVDDALDVINNIPTAHYHNYILTDKHGEAALIEIACSKRGIKRIGSISKEKCLVATNHFTLPGMIPYDAARMKQSVLRYETIVSRVRSSFPRVDKGTIRSILSQPMPKGVCCHHYTDFLGTLWSMIFDVTKTNVEICFGAPSINEWRQFGLHSPVGLAEYVANLPDKYADPGIWKKLSPDEV